MNKTLIASLITLAFSQSLIAAENINLDDVTVKANRFEQKDTETTYASEIHTAKQIEASGVATLYDFLAQQTSLNILSSFGNKATPSINLRGYGNENGFQNVVITVDGQRLNNIDQSPQLLGAIPLGNIERIEITKGSGSVLYGDGATAGSIQIYTKNKTGVTVSTSFGNFGQQNHYVNAGISEKYIDLSASLAHDSYDGFSKKAADGEKDTFESNAQNAKLTIKPTDFLKFNVEGTSSRTDVRYPNSLTKTQFDNDSRQNGKPLNNYTHQNISSDQWRIGTEYDITKSIKLTATHYQEHKISEFPGYMPTYDYRSNDFALSFTDEMFKVITGYQTFDGTRDDSFNKTSKDNESYFLQGEYRMDDLTLSAGARRENVKYFNRPVADITAKGDNQLNTWDVGLNYRFNPELSVFTNYNKSFQSPDIDRSFLFDTAIFQTVFSGFIKPAQAKTFNIGLNHVVSNNRFKATAFYSRLQDEIYLDPTFIDPVFGFAGRNTNADKTHKYGLELQDFFKISDHLSSSIIYNYTRAIVYKEIAFDGTEIKNKDLPGAPKHTLVANLNYQFLNHATFNLNHTWRSKAYAFNDFQNNFNQQQEHYESTNVALNYQYKNYQVFTSINNIFEHENSIQVQDDAIYPVDFVRTWRVGVKADF